MLGITISPEQRFEMRIMGRWSEKFRVQEFAELQLSWMKFLLFAVNKNSFSLFCCFQSSLEHTTCTMHTLRCGAVLIVISLITISCDALADFTNSRRTKCEIERTYKMLGYDCVKLELKEVPKYLKSSTEVSLLFSSRRAAQLSLLSCCSAATHKWNIWDSAANWN